MSKVFIKNKKALQNFHILESLEAGIELTGMEVKSIRAGRVELSQSFARVVDGEAFMINVHIPPYNNAPAKDYNPDRNRRLLLHKSQIQTLVGTLSRAGTTLVIVSLYDKNNMIKAQLGIARSKRQIDKKRLLKLKDETRDLEREIRDKQ
jgi:SsrA-binding protein